MKAFRANVLEPDVYHLNPAKSDNMQFRKFVRSKKSMWNDFVILNMIEAGSSLYC